MDLYLEIEQAIRQHVEYLNVENNVTESDVRHAIRCVMRDNPDIFWFVHQYHFDNENGVISFRYRCSQGRSVIIQESINDVVEKEFQINYVRTLTQLEQVVYVYKWLLTYCNYNLNSAYNQNIDSVFIRRNSVCTGYAKAAQYLFKLLGIESCLVFGRLNNDKEDGRHCWNIVNIDGHYYHLDVCLGDLSLEDVLNGARITAIQRYGDYNYNCFCVSTDEILKTRSIEDVETLPLCDSNLPVPEIERLSRIDIKERNGLIGCQLTHIGSTADIFLCTRDKNVVLKKFRENDTKKCKEEYGFMKCLNGCKHLLHLNSAFSDVGNNILAMEQSTPIVDLFCSHYYHPTLNGVLMMIKDITLGWLECRQQGIIYRDIHVCNVYKSNDGWYKLGDFGSCAYECTRLREKVGSHWFMSPETYISGQFDERSAVYSITFVLYFILNGMRLPFITGNNEKEALQRKINGESLPEPTLLQSIPEDFAKVVMLELVGKGCAFYPSKRIQTCKELLYTIEKLRSTLINQRIELRFSQQDIESIVDNKSISNIYISRDIHHKFASGEGVEPIGRFIGCTFPQENIENIATTGCPIIDTDDNGSLEEAKLDGLTTALESDDVNGGSTLMSDEVENYCRTAGRRKCTYGLSSITVSKSASVQNPKQGFDYVPNPNESDTKGIGVGSVISAVLFPISNFIGGISGFFSRKDKYDEVYSSIFAPSEISYRSHLLVQVYLHLFEDTEKVKTLAQESDKDTERRDYIPLQCKLKKGDKVDLLLNIYGESLLMSDKKNVVWQGSFTKCSFDFFVPGDIDDSELSCVVLLSVNGVPVGEMRFITKIVVHPRKLNPEIIAHKYKKVFISYSHEDESKVKFLHEGLELGSVDNFFDRKSLKTGDVFPQVIQDYINSADLFILCWSENASNSDYVQKERLLALSRAFPQVKPEKEAKLRIHPISIEPYTELPNDMKENYHFGKL